MRYTASILLIMFSLGLVHSQDTDTSHKDKLHLFSLYAGFSECIERDGAMSPFKYKGHSLPVEISYRYSVKKSHQIFYANFDNLRLSSSLPDYDNEGLNHYVKSTNIQMGYSYLRKALSFPEYHFNIYLGGEISSLLNLRKHAYIYNNEFLMLDQFNSLGFKALLEKRFSSNKQLACFSFNIPFVSYVLMGNTYNAYVGEKIDPLMSFSGNTLLYLAKKGDFVSFNSLVYFKTDFAFIQFFGDHIGVECRYSMRYYKFTQYQDLNYSKNLQNQFLIGLVGKL